MWVLNMRTLIIVFVFAVLATFAVEHFGFAIAHSTAALFLAVLMAPGLLLAFFNWGDSSESMLMILATFINGVYYYFLAWLIRYLVARTKDVQS